MNVVKRYSLIILLWFFAFSVFLFFTSYSRQHDMNSNRLNQLSLDLEEGFALPRTVAFKLPQEDFLKQALVSGDPGNSRVLFTSIAKISNIDYIYLIDRTGTVIAANESDTGIDLTGKNYSFRPYFRQAIDGFRCVYTAKGVTSHVVGCYFSAPVYESGIREPLGVIVVCIKVYNSRFSFSAQTAVSDHLIVSPEGVVIYGTVPEWDFLKIGSYANGFRESQQYGSEDPGILDENLSDGIHLVQTLPSFVSSKMMKNLPFRVISITPFRLLGDIKPVELLQVLLTFSGYCLFTILVIELVRRNRENRSQKKRLEMRLSWEQGIAEASRMLIASSHPETDLPLSLKRLLECWDLAGIQYLCDSHAPVTAVALCSDDCCSIGENSESSIQHVSIPVAVRNGDTLFGQLVFRCTRDSPVQKESGAMELLETYAWVLGVTLARQEDIHNLIILERELQMSHKMEAIGTLAGGIAHDFNNVLAAIRGSVELSLLSLDEPLVIEENLSLIRQASERAAEFVRQILAFSRQQAGNHKLLVLDDVIGEFIPLIRGGIPSNVEIHFIPDGQNLVFLGDKAQVGQILLNLCTNGAQAIDRGAGTLSISVASTTFTRNVESIEGPIPPGSYVILSVNDTGRGIARAVAKRIFEPFFTTRESTGTGLGLAVVHGIVKSHHGYIHIESELNKGTTISVFFPQQGGHAERKDIARHSIPDTKLKGKVMLIEDEHQLADLGYRILKKLGYEPVVHTSPSAGLDVFREIHSDCIAVIVDYHMPGMNGVELSRKIRIIDPDIPVFLTSGFLDEDIEQLPWITSVLYKPYNPDDLDSMIRSKGRRVGTLNS